MRQERALFGHSHPGQQRNCLNAVKALHTTGQLCPQSSERVINTKRYPRSRHTIPANNFVVRRQMILN